MYPAVVVRRSIDLQAALLKIDAQTPDYFDLSQPAGAEPADWLLAVSNAFKVAEGKAPLSVNIGVFSACECQSMLAAAFMIFLITRTRSSMSTKSAESYTHNIS